MGKGRQDRHEAEEMTLKQYNKMYRAERKEHPTLPNWAVKRIVKDHMKK
jgi:hypothetical protein